MKYAPYSPSKLDTGTCGYAFHSHYIAPKKEDKTESLIQARGSAIHEVLEYLTRKMIAQPDHLFTDAEIRDIVTRTVNSHPAAYEELEEVVDMSRKYLERPPRVLTDDAGIELRLAIKFVYNPDGTIATYEDTRTFPGRVVVRPQFEECDYDDPLAFARGRADILLISDPTMTPTYALIYDHKTQPNIEEADTFQMGFYSWVISRIYPFLDEIHTVLHFARYGKYSDSHTWTQQDLYKIEDQVLSRVSVIENKTFWGPTPHKNCQYCPLLTACPVVGPLLASGDTSNLRVLGDQNRAVAVAGTLHVLEELVGIAKKELREFVKKYEGAVAIPGRVYEFRTEEGINWDWVNKNRQAVFKIFEQHKVDPTPFMSFNQTASKLIWLTENEALVKDLAALFPRKASTKFEGYKT